MKKLLFSFILIVTAAGPLFALTAGEEFSEANSRYAEQKYEEAAKRYELLVKAGVSTTAVYYNLGNTYFKLGQLGRAIVSYERARRINPKDEEVLFNLSFAKSQLEQEQPKEPYRFHERLFFWVVDRFSEKECALLLLASYTLLFLALILATFSGAFRKRSPLFIWLFVTVTFLFAFLSGVKIFERGQGKEGVIVAKVADVRYSPSGTGAVAFELKEGIRAKILRTESDFCYIRLTRDKLGWVAREAIEEI